MKLSFKRAPRFWAFGGQIWGFGGLVGLWGGGWGWGGGGFRARLIKLWGLNFRPEIPARPAPVRGLANFGPKIGPIFGQNWPILAKPRFGPHFWAKFEAKFWAKIDPKLAIFWAQKKWAIFGPFLGSGLRFGPFLGQISDGGIFRVFRNANWRSGTS